LKNASAQGAIILGAGITIGILDAALVASGRGGFRGSFQYVPLRIWFVAPLCWAAIAGVIGLLLLPLLRRHSGAVAAIAVFFSFVALRVRTLRPSLKLLGMAVAIGMAVVVWILIRRWASRPQPVAAGIVVMLIAVAALALTIEPPGASGSRSRFVPEAPNVIVVFLDTVRYDAVFAADGEVREGLPSLRRLARESVVFDRAYAPSPWTLPSHLAAVTGVPAENLGIDFDHQTYRGPRRTLAERFRRRGYETAAVISNTFLSRGTGFERGFDRYEHSVNALDVCRTAPGTLLDGHWPWFAATICNWSASEVTRRALARMDDSDAPFFLVLNYMDAHDPYYVERDCGEPDSYGAALRCLDRRLASIVDWRSKRRGTILAVLSDHGEQFGEHNLIHHGNSLYVQLLHVPMMIRMPGVAPARVGEPVSISELASTVEKGSVAHFRDHPRAPVTSILIPPRALGRSFEGAAIDSSFHLISRGNGTRELYHLPSDPAETKNLIEDRQYASRVEVLERPIRAMQRSLPPDSGSFRSLGYIQ